MHAFPLNKHTHILTPLTRHTQAIQHITQTFYNIMKFVYYIETIDGDLVEGDVLEVKLMHVQ